MTRDEQTMASFASARSALKRSQVRSLRSDEADPPGEPRRYPDSSGYVRLRWKVAPRQYVERYERDTDGSILRTRPKAEQKRIDVARAAEMYGAGENLPAIAEALGCDAGALSRALRRHGVSMRTSSQSMTPHLDREQVVEMYRAGHGCRAIADTLGVSHPTIETIVRQAGLTRRPGRPPKAGPGSTPTYDTEFKRARKKVAERSGGRCEGRIEGVCTGAGEHVHHRKLRTRGGDNSLTNLMHLCLRCHTWAHANPATSTERGLLVPSWEETNA